MSKERVKRALETVQTDTKLAPGVKLTPPLQSGNPGKPGDRQRRPIKRQRKAVKGGKANDRGGPKVRRCSVDFSKLKRSTLRKYVKNFNLRTVHLYSNKDDLCRAIEEHFAEQEVREDEVALALCAKINNAAEKR